jgi:AraC-type transcriptional regulator N-terminus
VAFPRRLTIACSTSGATDGIVDAVTRLLDLMAQAEDAGLLGPLVLDDILIRLVAQVAPRLHCDAAIRYGLHTPIVTSGYQSTFTPNFTIRGPITVVAFSNDAPDLQLMFTAVSEFSALKRSTNSPSFP